MTRLASIATTATCAFLASLTTVLADPPATSSALARQPAAASAPAASPAPAEKCLGDLRAFSLQMSKDGYWVGGYGYGYPMDRSGYGYGMPLSRKPARNATGYGSARPGYEIRILVTSANILARMGEEQPCQTVLATIRTTYARYASGLQSRGIPPADQQAWRQRQIDSAAPRSGMEISFRSDQWLGRDVVNSSNVVLGSAHDLVFSPYTGKIAYLIIARGGPFETQVAYVPIPWGAIKAAPDAALLLVDTTQAAMRAAPQVHDNQFSENGQFDDECQRVDAYWISRVKFVAATN